MSDFYFDFETASCCDLSERGLHNYATDPTTRILMMAYAFGDGQVHLWEPTPDSDLPEKVRAALLDPETRKVCWNASFERAVCKYVLGVEIPFDQFCDAMIHARHLSLPGSLEECGEVLGLREDEKKIKDGRRLIHKFCEPFSMGGEETLFGITQPEFHDKNSDPEDWAKFQEYCKRDVETERTLLKTMSRLPLPEIEQRGWILDQKINETGLPVNVQFVDNALYLAQRSKDELNVLLKEKTGLDNPNSRNQILEWAKGQGYPHESMGKAFVNAALSDTGLTPLCREVLKIRQEASKTSYKKFEAIKNIVSPDGRLRNQYMYMGASRTGRWSGSGVQVQNLPRPDKETENNYDLAIELIKNRDYDGIKKNFQSVIGTVTSCVRSSFQAPEGRLLAVADFAAIENRVLGWLAGCDGILKVFREGLDPYVSFATKMYNQPYEVLIKDKAKRQIAKPAVLGAGYGLGGGELKIDHYGNTVKSGLWGYAEAMGVKMTQEEAHMSVRVFRESYPEVVQMWKNLDNAAIDVLTRGGKIQTNFLTFSRIKRKDGTQILRMELPSGRGLHYMNARVEIEKKEGRDGKEYEKRGVLYDGIGHGIGKIGNGWGPCRAYGGKWTENGTQAIARCTFLAALFLADERGAEIILHSHDEAGALIYANDPFGFGLSDLLECMSITPNWAPGLPIHSEGWEGPIYRKS